MMKTFKLGISITIVMVVVLITGCNTHGQKTGNLENINKLSWMENIWRGKQGDAKIYESWHKVNFNLIDGISYTTDHDGNRIFSQDMRIEQNDNHIYYIIKLPGDQQRRLILTAVTDTSATFENTETGYPQTIVYKHPADDSMTVYLEGTNEGTAMNTKLSYEKD